VSLPPTSNLLDRNELLAAELKAIEHWDAEYWRKAWPDTYETLAYMARRERRAEILSQLRILMPQLNNGTQSENAETEPDNGSTKRSPRVKQDEKTERRRHQRVELEAEVMVRTKNILLPGRAQDISDAGMSAILPVELHEGEQVEIHIKLHGNIATTRAIVRDRCVFRHGFEFLQPLHGESRRQVGANDCEVCGATGFILCALAVDGEQGVAFASRTCLVCRGTGTFSE
jgi:hypothetical protein